MLRILSLTEGIVGKKKLIVCFAVIIIIAIGFLYYESIYNISNRVPFKPISPFNIDDSLEESESPNKSKPSKDIDIKGKTNVLKDNINYQNKTKCWETEKFSLSEKCERCDLYSLKFIQACIKTGYKELVDCDNYGLVSRSCQVPDHVLSKRYWSFELICLVFTGIFSSFVINRKRLLDKQAMERMRQQILS